MEIDKLSAVASDSDEISTEDVAAMVGVRHGETLRDWVSAILARDIPSAVGMLASVLAGAGVNGVRMVIALGPALIGVSLAVALAEKGMPARRIEGAVFDAIRTARPQGLGNWKQEATLWAKAAERWTSHEIAAALRAAYECDLALKSTTLSNERGILSTMLLRMSTTREAG
jgi:DNA polymerase III delta subunit